MKNNISIIIPVYNAQQYLTSCLESVLNQTYKNIEIILVNDGSTDESSSIINKYKDKDKRIVVIDKENEGVSIARNIGIENATSDWIMFVDSDDILEKEAVETLANYTEGFGEVILSRIYLLKNGEKTEALCKYNENKIFEKEEKRELEESIFYDNKKEKISYISCPFAKLYNKKFLQENNIKFTEGLKYGEDGIFNLESFHLANKITFVNKCTYQYRINSQSVMNTYDPKLIENYTKMLLSFESVLQQFNLSDFYKNEYLYFVLRQVNKFLKFYLFKTENGKEKFNELLQTEPYHTAIYKEKIKFLSPKRKAMKFLLRNKQFYLLKKIYNRDYKKIYMKAFLAENLGDDLFVKILTERYLQHKFYAVSSGFKGYKNRYPNLKVYTNSYFFRILRKFKMEKYLANKCDLVVSIGGSMYMEKSPKDKEREFILGKNKYYILGSNFGPYKTDEYFENVKKSFEKAEDVCFREKYSYQLFKDIENVRCAPDIVFSMDVSKVQNDNSKKVIFSVISCSQKDNADYEEDYENKIVELIQYFVQNGYEVGLMSFCKMEGDELAIKRILEKCDSKIQDKIFTYYYRGNFEEALNVLGHSEIIVGTRFHANIIGMILGKTIIPIAYSKKTINTLEDMNFKGKIIELKTIKDFQVESLTKEELEYKQNIDKQREEAIQHFIKLDKALGKK